MHGWREFACEVAIIVLGVGIALAAEQIVEASHWHNVVAAEEQALEQEVSANETVLLARVMQQPCIDRRLSELAEVFRRHDGGQLLRLIGPIGRPTVFGGSKSTLDMATADQSLSHMPLARKQAIFSAYGSYDIFAPTAEEERSGWRVLQALDHPGTLDAADWRDLRKAYDGIVDNNVSLKTNLRSDTDGQWLTPFKPFGRPRTASLRALAHSVHSLPYVQQLCRPILAPSVEASITSATPAARNG